MLDCYTQLYLNDIALCLIEMFNRKSKVHTLNSRKNIKYKSISLKSITLSEYTPILHIQLVLP